MGGIFDNLEIVGFGQGTHPGAVANLPSIMHRNNRYHLLSVGFGGGNSFGRVADVEVQVLETAICKQGDGIKVAHDLGCSCKGHGWDHYPLAGRQADCLERQVKRSSAGVDRYRILVLHVTGEFRLEPLCFWSGG